MADVRFRSIEDGDLADLWYCVAGGAIRHTDRFKALGDALLTELLDRRGDGLNPWLNERFRDLRRSDAPVDAALNRPE